MAAGPSMTVSQLLDSIKRRAMIPVSQQAFSDDDLIAFANEEISFGILPDTLNQKEEFYVYAVEVNVVAGKTSYQIPYRAIGGKLRDIFFKDSGGSLYEMTRISPEARADQSESILYPFFVQNNSIVINDSLANNLNGTFLMSFYMRPNQLVQEERVGVISSFDTTTGVITLNDTVPSNITAGSKIDFLERNPNHSTLGFDVDVLAVSGSTITVDPNDLPDELASLDHVSSAGECIIPQIPADLHVMLAQRVATRCLEALGDTQGLTNANQKLQEMIVKSSNIIDDRVAGSPLKVINRFGHLRSGKNGRC